MPIYHRSELSNDQRIGAGWCWRERGLYVLTHLAIPCQAMLSVIPVLVDQFQNHTAGAKHKVVTGHSNFENKLPNKLRASFYWAPYMNNVTQFTREWWGTVLYLSSALWWTQKAFCMLFCQPLLFTRSCPDCKRKCSDHEEWHVMRCVHKNLAKCRLEDRVLPSAILISFGLWPILHIREIAAFQNDLKQLQSLAAKLEVSVETGLCCWNLSVTASQQQDCSLKAHDD